MSDGQFIKQRIKQLVATSLKLAVDPAEIPDDEILIGQGLSPPSMATLEIICALEDEFGFEVDDDDLRLDLFQSVNALAAYVKNKQLQAREST